MAVRPEWSRLGLATVLVLLLAKAAAERGIYTFSASYLAENRPVTALVEDAGGMGGQVIEQGIAEFSLALDRPQPGTGPAAKAAGGLAGRHQGF